MLINLPTLKKTSEHGCQNKSKKIKYKGSTKSVRSIRKSQTGVARVKSPRLSHLLGPSDGHRFRFPVYIAITQGINLVGVKLNVL